MPLQIVVSIKMDGDHVGVGVKGEVEEPTEDRELQMGSFIKDKIVEALEELKRREINGDSE